MQTLTITEINIVPVKPKAGHVGFASVLLNNSVRISNLAIYKRLDGSVRIVYPSRALPNGHIIDLIKPINRTAGNAITEAIASEYSKLEKQASKKPATRNGTLARKVVAILIMLLAGAASPAHAITETQTEQLIEKLILAESSGRANVAGDGGKARGLMQIVKGTWRRHTDEPFSRAFDPVLNRKVGAAEVRRIIRVYRERGVEPPVAYVAWTYNTGSFIKRYLPKFDKHRNFHPWTWNHPNRIYRGIYREYLRQ